MMAYSIQSAVPSSAVSNWSAAVIVLFTSLPAQLIFAQSTQADWDENSNFSVSQSAPDIFIDSPDQSISTELPEPAFNPYRLNDLEPAIEMGIVYQEAGEHEVAIKAFNQALQITRIKYGLYHEAQIPLLEGIILSSMEVRDWESVDKRYAYMEHLYRKLYDVDDPRLENGLQKVSSFHVSAFNINLDGRREYHLRRAATVFRTRLEVAENTLDEGHPRFEYLNEGIANCREQLYRMSNAERESEKSSRDRVRDRLLADLD